MQVVAQDYAGSHVCLSRKTSVGMISESCDNGVLKVSENKSELTFNLPLSPVLNSVNDNDSVARIHRNAVLNFRAHFPVTDLQLSAQDLNQKLYSLEGILEINGIEKPYRLNFHLSKPGYTDLQTAGKDTYAAQMNFVLEFDTSDFGISSGDNKEKNSVVTIKVAAGVLNKIE
jgi:polyisoprenoid-binding protein YceI